ncbi:MAG: 4-hydroxy-3-methylbut-2-enyl diphosphate reductase [Treponema sp.]|nr:4-hydroxy-3-methylbut-2-enyl diphosphate reductase [Treponema sp.]
MTVKRARCLGFCMGVRRAVALAYKEIEDAKASGFPVYTYGALIHNPEVLKDLKNKGVETLDGLPYTSDCSVIIRAHGISPVIEKELRGAGCCIIDATCPKVKESQLKTQELLQAGFCLFLAGEAKHPEIEGIAGYAKQICRKHSGAFSVVSNENEAQKAAELLLKKRSKAKTALLGQTTISEEEYRCIGDVIKKYFPNLEIVDTICGATSERQQALRELLPEVDAVIVAGGKDSSNTRRLLAIADSSGKPCALIEEAEEIPKNFFLFKTVGLCAGASTDDCAVEKIENALK